MKMMSGNPQGSAGQETALGNGRRPAARSIGKLTTRQMEIVRLAQEGLRPTAIACLLCLSVETVRRTIKDACLTLDVHGLPELLAEARRRGLIPTG